MIYIHVPFCRSFCTYCDFYSEAVAGCRGGEPWQGSVCEEFTEALCAEIEANAELVKKHIVSNDVAVPNTLYIGGGTPSLMPLDFFAAILEKLRAVAGVPELDFEEFTVEVNPDDIVEKGTDYVRGLMALGVKRISMGVQSFDEGILRFMNRRHSVAAAKSALEILKQVGVDNISIDLIFGLPQLSEALWRDTVRQAVVFAPKHISAYQLSIESGSALAEMVTKGKFVEAGQEVCSRQYDILCEELAAHGYNHYEISNFAKPGYEAVHNSAYWAHVPYLGLGPAAHSFLHCGDGTFVRRWNKADLSAYIKARKTCAFAALCESETLTGQEIKEEKIMLALRRAKGIDADYLRSHCDPDVLQRLTSQGLLVEQSSAGQQKSAFRIPEKHFFISDSIIIELM